LQYLAQVSPRNFARSYKAKTGRTPAKAVEMFRLEAARRLPEDTEQGVDRIARSCGFGDEERMHHVPTPLGDLAPRLSAPVLNPLNNGYGECM
jgi:transcriptional regulator GlxA family with amidase domain